MDKFWKWIDKKQYGFKDELLGVCGYPEKQMLIGYMIEYLFENGFDESTLNTVIQTEPTIEKYYGYLEETINGIDK